MIHGAWQLDCSLVLRGCQPLLKDHWVTPAVCQALTRLVCGPACVALLQVWPTSCLPASAAAGSSTQCCKMTLQQAAQRPPAAAAASPSRCGRCCQTSSCGLGARSPHGCSTCSHMSSLMLTWQFSPRWTTTGERMLPTALEHLCCSSTQQGIRQGPEQQPSRRSLACLQV